MHLTKVHRNIIMILKKNIFEIGRPTHVISRAVEERNIFKEEIDCFRYIFQLYSANLGKPARNLCRLDVMKIAYAILQGEEISSTFILKEHPPLVDFLDFSLVVNHSHLYLVPNFEYSIPALMQNLNNGFAQYFNLRYHRKGALFGGRYRAVIAKTQYQSDAISRYVSVINPLDVFQSGWREDGLKDREKAFKFLKKYPFSSFPDKMGERKSKLLAPNSILEKYLTLGSDIKTYREFVVDFIRERSNIPDDLCLE